MVADGKYHVVELLSIKKNFTLRVDKGLARSIINQGEQEFLRLTSPLYIGGIPPEPGQNAFSQWHLRNVTSFNGGKLINTDFFNLCKVRWNCISFQCEISYCYLYIQNKEFWVRVVSFTLINCKWLLFIS